MKTITVTVPDNYNWDEKNYRFKVEEKKIQPAYLGNMKVGDKALTNLGEVCELISTNGPEAFPYIFLVHRIDVGKDDTGFFSIDGWFNKYSKKYYIKEILKNDK